MLWCVCAFLAIAAISVFVKDSIISVIISASIILVPLQLSEEFTGWHNNVNIGLGIHGNPENVNLFAPMLNVLLWVGINLVIVAMIYPMHRKK